MKRRDFLITTGLAGASVPVIGFGQSAPCPPPTLAARGGTAATTACVVGNPTAEADWVLRSTGPGVVWAHDFRSDAEVNQFRWTVGYGNDPNSTQERSTWCRRIATDGITGGGCLEIFRPAGTREPAGWSRPFAAIRAGDNGLTRDDAAAGGTVPRRAWPATIGTLGNFDFGGYAHADYAAPHHDGTEFFLQYRVKVAASRWQGGNERFDGKMSVFQVNSVPPAFDLVNHIRGDRLQRLYTAFGSPGPLEFLNDPQSSGSASGTRMQPGGAYNDTCKIGNTNVNTCWSWPADEWVTILFHIRPGHVVQDDWGPADWGVAMYAARAGQRTYTTVYNKSDYRFYYSAAGKFRGWNVCIFNGYHNGQNMPQAFWMRYDQVIFSRQMIPCPQV